MIDALVLAAIAHAVDHDGDADLALAALRRADPLLRGAASRRLRAAHADALLAVADKHDALHALRVAYLQVARIAAPAADVAAVEAAFAEARARCRSPSRFWWPTAALCLALAASGAAAAAFALHDAAPPLTDRADRAAPPPRGAFAAGGVPGKLPGDEVIHRVLARDLASFLIALDGLGDHRVPAADAEKALAEARALATGPDAAQALGPGATRALDALFTAARGAAAASPGKADDPADQAFALAAAELDDELAALGAGYFVDADVIHDGASGRRLPIVYAFAVERVDLFPAEGSAVRAVRVRRIDRLNWKHTLLGFTRPHLRAAVVLLDQLDDQTLTLVAPGLAPGASVRLFDAEARGVPPELRAAVEARAGELTRLEYGALPGLDGAAAERLGKALGDRRALFEVLEKRAEAHGMALVIPSLLRLSDEHRSSLRGLLEPAEDKDLASIEAALRADAAGQAFTTLRDALAASVTRHEVQHRLDARRPLRMPEELAARVGPAEKDGREQSHASHARAELSAYLAELARDDRTGRVGLTMVARMLFDGHMHGTAESYAALAIVEGLAAELALPPEAPLVAGRRIDRAAVARRYLALAALPPERLREAARRLWEKLYGVPLVVLRAAAP
jgi:hypothetical protein